MPAPEPDKPKAPTAPTLPDDAPRILWLSGNPDFSGRYELVEGCFQNERPVYQRVVLLSEAAVQGDLFLWYRGGNWSVTKTLQANPLAAPFLTRCGDSSGRSRHPLDIRKPRWHVRRGRNQEDLDPNICLSPSAPSPADSAGYSQVVPPTAGPGAVLQAAPEAKSTPAASARSSSWPEWVS